MIEGNPVTPEVVLETAVLRRVEGSYGMISVLRDSKLSGTSLDHLMRGPHALQVLKDLSQLDRTDVRYLISAIVSSMGYDQIPQDIRDRLGVRFKDTQDRVSLVHPEDAGVCAKAEGFMIESMEEGTAFLVNDWMLMKQVERQLALCLETTATRAGTFIRGGWYSPNGEQASLDAYMPLYGHEVELPWSYFRNVSAELPETHTNFMAKVDSYAQGIRNGAIQPLPFSLEE